MFIPEYSRPDGPFTLEMWLKAAPAPTDIYLPLHFFQLGQTRSWLEPMDANRFSLHTKTEYGSRYIAVRYDANDWHHIAWVFTSDGAEVYLDGAPHTESGGQNSLDESDVESSVELRISGPWLQGSTQLQAIRVSRGARFDDDDFLPPGAPKAEDVDASTSDLWIFDQLSEGNVMNVVEGRPSFQVASAQIVANDSECTPQGGRATPVHVQRCEFSPAAPSFEDFTTTPPFDRPTDLHFTGEIVAGPSGRLYMPLGQYDPVWPSWLTKEIRAYRRNVNAESCEMVLDDTFANSGALALQDLEKGSLQVTSDDHLYWTDGDPLYGSTLFQLWPAGATEHCDVGYASGPPLVRTSGEVWTGWGYNGNHYTYQLSSDGSCTETGIRPVDYASFGDCVRSQALFTANGTLIMTCRTSSNYDSPFSQFLQLDPGASAYRELDLELTHDGPQALAVHAGRLFSCGEGLCTTRYHYESGLSYFSWLDSNHQVLGGFVVPHGRIGGMAILSGRTMLTTRDGLFELKD